MEADMNVTGLKAVWTYVRRQESKMKKEQVIID